MAAHVSDWGNSLNPRRRGGKQVTMVVMFVGEVVSVLDGISVLFLMGWGVFDPAQKFSEPQKWLSC